MIALRWDNRIYGNLIAAVSSKCTNVVRQQQTTASTFPTVELQLISASGAAQDLANGDNGAFISYQVQIYTSGSNKFTDARELADLVHGCFKTMGFVLESLSPVTNIADTSVYRLTARYRRFIGSGETIANIE